MCSGHVKYGSCTCNVYEPQKRNHVLVGRSVWMQSELVVFLEAVQLYNISFVIIVVVLLWYRKG